jgi:hypothetical protein
MKPNIDAVVLVAVNHAESVRVYANDDELRALVNFVLFEGKDLWACLEEGLVRREEVAAALGAHVHTMLVRKSGRPHKDVAGDNQNLVAKIEIALFSCRE